MRFGDSRIHVTDVDCMFVVERRGKFLWIEWKETDELLTDGQRILAEQLSRIHGFTVLVVRGNAGSPTTLERVFAGEWGDVKKTNKEDFQTRLDAWFEAANGVHSE